jgi:hypothetical protein
MGCTDTPIPDQEYYIGNVPLLIEFSDFSIVPNTTDQTGWNTTYKAYWNKQNTALKDPL